MYCFKCFTTHTVGLECVLDVTENLEKKNKKLNKQHKVRKKSPMRQTQIFMKTEKCPKCLTSGQQVVFSRLADSNARGGNISDCNLIQMSSNC